MVSLGKGQGWYSFVDIAGYMEEKKEGTELGFQPKSILAATRGPYLLRYPFNFLFVRST